VSGEFVGEVVTCAIDRRRSLQIELFDKCAQRVGDRAFHRIDATVVDARNGCLARDVRNIVDPVEIIARPSIHDVSARSTIQQVVSGTAIELVVAAIGVEPIFATKAIKLFASATANEILIGLGSENFPEFRDFHGAPLWDEKIYIRAGRETDCYSGLGLEDRL